MPDDTRPPDETPADLAGRIEQLATDGWRLLAAVEVWASEVDRICGEVERLLAGLDDDDHRSSSSAVGLPELYAIIDRFAEIQDRLVA